MTLNSHAYLLNIAASVAVQVILAAREVLEQLETIGVPGEDIRPMPQLIDEIDTIRMSIIEESNQVLDEPAVIRRCRERFAELQPPVDRLWAILEKVTKRTNLAHNEEVLAILKLKERIIMAQTKA